MKKNIYKLSLTEISISLSIVFLLFLSLFFYYFICMPYTYTDTAFLIESVDRLSRDEGPSSYILSESLAQITLATKSNIADFCSEGLETKMYAQVPLQYITSLHAYIILYPISIMAKYIGSFKFLSILNALTFSIIPALVYFYTRLRNQRIVFAILTTILILVHPAWQISSTGQLYVDRFFIPFSMVLTFLTYHYQNAEQNNNKLIPLIFITMLIAGITTERAMFVSGLFLFFSGVTQKTSIKKNALIIFFGMIAFIYTSIYLNKYGGTLENASSISNFFAGFYHLKLYLIDVITKVGVGKFIFFNMPLFLVISILNPRLALCILPILLINFLISVGGAEKDGWETHYHSHYFGFLVAAFVISISDKSNRIINNINMNFVLLLLLVFFCSGYYYLNYWNRSIIGAIQNTFIADKSKSGFYANKSILDNLLLNLPTNASVTLSGWGLPLLYSRGNEVHLFPLNIGLSDYLLVQFDEKKKSILASYNYHLPSAQLDSCYTRIINKDYLLIKQEGTWALFKKNNLYIKNLSN